MRKKNLNVTRNRQENTVVLRIQRNGKMYHESFAISKFKGSWTKAEEAARTRRDELLPSMPERDFGKGRVTKRNTSGVVGVSLGQRVVTTAAGGQTTYARWISQWPECPRRGGMPWSVLTFGEDDAFVLAVLSRQLESVNRDEVLAALKKIKGKKAYKDILANRTAKAGTIAKRKVKAGSVKVEPAKPKKKKAKKAAKKVSKKKVAKKKTAKKKAGKKKAGKKQGGKKRAKKR